MQNIIGFVKSHWPAMIAIGLMVWSAIGIAMGWLSADIGVSLIVGAAATLGIHINVTGSKT